MENKIILDLIILNESIKSRYILAIVIFRFDYFKIKISWIIFIFDSIKIKKIISTNLELSIIWFVQMFR